MIKHSTSNLEEDSKSIEDFFMCNFDYLVYSPGISSESTKLLSKSISLSLAILTASALQ